MICKHKWQLLGEYNMPMHWYYGKDGKRKLTLSEPRDIVDVTFPACNDSNRLFKLISQIESILRENNSYGSIMRTNYLIDGGMTIGLFMMPSKVSNLVMKLANMAEVERVEENLQSDDFHSTLPNRYKSIPLSNVGSSRSVRVTLKDSELVGQKNTALWN